MSMPCIGRSSFLYNSFCWFNYLCDMCQCPMSGVLHFYLSCGFLWIYHTNVSMPYVGRSSFLRCYFYTQKLRRKRVSMPYVGRSSFLLHKQQQKMQTQLHVSMPYVGRSSFLQDMEMVQKEILDCVNALCRAFFISTLTSGNP